MDAFESVVGMLLERQGYWVRYSFKVELTKAEKRRIGKPSSPRPEIDLVAFKPSENEILAVECKSFLNSTGVQDYALLGMKHVGTNRYKLFTDKRLRDTVFKRLVQQLADMGACRPSAKVRLCLAAGKIAGKQDHNAITAIEDHFAKNDWKLFDPTWLRKQLAQLSDCAYENSIAVVVAKLMGDTERPD